MSPSPHQQSRFAWAVAAFLFAASVLNYMDRAALGVMMPQVRRDLGLSNFDYGLAVNAFMVSYTVFYVLGGRMADWLGCRRGYLWTIFVWSVASTLHAAVTGLKSLAFFRALLGVGESAFYPAAIRGASEWFPPETRAKAVGLLLSGLSVGTLLTPPLVAWIMVRRGWRAAFLVTGLLGFFLIPGWLWLHRRISTAYGTPDPAPALADAASQRPGEPELPLGQALRRRKFWCILASRASGDAAWYFYLFWMPGYFQEVRGYTPAMVGGLLWIPYFVAGIGALAGAWASSALIRRGMQLDRGRKAVMLPSALMCMTGAAAFFAPAHGVALALVSLALFGHQAWSSNIHTAITEISPPAHVAILYGMTGGAGTLVGAVSQPLIGWVIDIAGYRTAFLSAGAAYVAALTLLAAAGRIERMRPREAA